MCFGVGRRLRYYTLIERKIRRRVVPQMRTILFCDHVEKDGERPFRGASDPDLKGKFYLLKPASITPEPTNKCS
jgi:hypothetical protein